MIASTPDNPRRWRLGIFTALLIWAAGCFYVRAEITIDFEQAEITGRWVDAWTNQGVIFVPAHAPTRSKAKPKLMFFPHLPSGRKGILSAMADDPIPVRARFINGCSLVTVRFWGSLGSPARLAAYDGEGKLVDRSELAAIPGRKAPGDPIPTFELTVKGTNIAYIEFSGPRASEYLAADEMRYVPLTATADASNPRVSPTGNERARSEN